jgi:hypothetical protein
MDIAGFKIFINNSPIGHKQFRFPRSKKKRIRKKWSKRPQNYKPVYIEGVLMDQVRRVVYCTSAAAEALRKSIG